jgi:hypothetical protein
MDLHPTLAAGTDPMRVVGRDALGMSKAFAFGEYGVRDVDEGWRKSTSVGVLSVSRSHRRQERSFTLVDPQGANWSCRCLATASSTDTELNEFLGGTLEMELEGKSVYAGTFEGPGGEAYDMVLTRGTAAYVLSGYLTDGVDRFEVRGTRRLAGTSIPLSDPAGYEFFDGGTIVGAVEVINQGGVWIVPEITGDRRTALAAASASLLLYRDLRE